MITIKNKRTLQGIEQAGKRLAEILAEAQHIVVPGITTLALDSWLADQLKKHGLVSCCKGYMGYKHVSCISVNDVIVHGVPSDKVFLKEGDSVTLDICASWKKFCADTARCFFVGKSSKVAYDLARVAMASLDKGIEKACVGGRLTDISAAIQHEVEKNGFGVVRDFCGHGIGKKMHEEPEILNYGQPGRGPVLRAGMVFAIEPMITQGDYRVKLASDGWTAKTVDGGLAAHVEDTVIITDNGPQVATRL